MPENCFWCGQQCGGTCLRLQGSTQMKTRDPAYWMLADGVTSTPTPGIYKEDCYICRDPEFAQMGLPLCKPCYKCGGHVAADEEDCDQCGITQNPYDSEDREYILSVLGPEKLAEMVLWTLEACDRGTDWANEEARARWEAAHPEYARDRVSDPADF